ENPTNANDAFTVDTSHVVAPYIDIGLAPTASQHVDTSTLGTDDFTLGGAGSGVQIAALAPTQLPSTNVYRYYLSGSFTTGTVSVTFTAGKWSDTAGPSIAAAASFSIVAPSSAIAGPFNGTTIDVAVANAARDDSGKLYVDISYTPTPGSGLDYTSVLASTLTVGGSAVSTETLGSPQPIQMATDATSGSITAQVFSSTAVNDLQNANITRFRYSFAAGATNYAPGTLTVTVGSWQDSHGNGGGGETFNITVLGPTADIAQPTAGSTVDVNVLNGQTYVDVTFPTPPSGYAIDWNSVTTLEPMFTLTGPGVGNAKIDTSQAPAIVDQGLGKVRYWVIGSFVSGDVKATFVPGGPPFVTTLGSVDGTGVAPFAVDQGPGTLDVVFPNVATTDKVDITSLDFTQFTLGGTGLGSVQ